MPATGPTTDRIEALDALRGVAVLGIFVINIIGFALPEIAFSNPKVAGGHSALDYGLWSFTTVFVEGSMRGLFSMMFGASVLLFLGLVDRSATQRRGAGLFYQRHALLVVFGLIHAFALLMPGDILLVYGIAGMLLYPLRRMSTRMLATAFLTLLAAFSVHALWFELEETRLGQRADEIVGHKLNGGSLFPGDAETVAEWATRKAANWRDTDELREEVFGRTGSTARIYALNAVWTLSMMNPADLAWDVADAVMLMLFGMALCRWGVLTGGRSPRFYWLLLLVAYAAGLGFRGWAVAGRWEANFSPILWAWASFDQIARVAVTLGHVGLFFTVWKWLAGTPFMRALAATGRMALTVYIAETVLANLVFTGIGLGLYGSLARSEIYVVMLVIWAVLVGFCVAWLARFRFGPLEWGWRALTYGKRPRLRR